MNRRSFMTALAGLPIVGAVVFPKPKAKSGITVHGPEWIVFRGFYPRDSSHLGAQNKPIPSLRFENVPCTHPATHEMINRLSPLYGVVNRSDWHCHGDAELRIVDSLESARTWMFTDVGISSQGKGLCSVICGFTPASQWSPWDGSHRPVDFETEILKALTG